jgi:hypothetical protein
MHVRRIENEMMYLWDWEHGGKVDNEVVLEVPDRDLVRITDELSAAEDAGAGRDERDAELEDHVREVEEVGESAYGGDDDADAHVHGHARVVAVRVEEVEVERVDEQPDEAGHEEEAVPPEHGVVARVQDAARRCPRPAVRPGGPCRAGPVVEEGQRRAAERRQDVPVDEGGHGGRAWPGPARVGVGEGRGGRAGGGARALDAAWEVRTAGARARVSAFCPARVAGEHGAP